MTTRTRAATPVQRTTQAPLFDATTHRLLTWEHLPQLGTPLTIMGMPGVVWAYVGPMQFGRDYQAVCLVRWQERDNRYAERVVCPVGWVLEDKETEVR